jgi:hypothetical protein
MATNDEIIAKLPGAIEKLNETNKRAAAKAALDEKRKLADLKKQQTKANKKGAAKTREDKDAIQELKDLRADIKDRGAREEAAAASTAGQAIALKAQIEKDGKVAEDNKEFQKLSYEARKEDYAQRLKNATSPAAKKQIKEDARADAKKNGSKLDKIGAGITGLFEIGKKGMKAAALGGLAILTTLAIGAFVIALGKFLQSDTFKKMTKFISEVILPKLMEFWEFLKNNWEEIAVLIAGIITALAIAKFIEIAKKVRLAFLAIKTFMMVTMLDNVKGMIGGVVGKFKAAATLIKNAFIAVQVFMLETMLPAVKNMAGGVVGKFAALAGKIAAAFTAVVTFMSATMLPALSAFMIPLLPFIAIGAAIGLVLYGLWNAFKDFQSTLEETGSIGEALKVGASKFIGTITGFIPMLILKLVSWVAGLFGFDDFAAKVDAIDPIQYISDTIGNLIDGIVNFFTNLFDFDFTKLLGDLLGKAGKIGSKIAGLFGYGEGGEPDKSTKTKTRRSPADKNTYAPDTYNSKLMDDYRQSQKNDANPDFRPFGSYVDPDSIMGKSAAGGQAQKLSGYEKDKVKRSAAGAGGGSGGPTNIVDARQSSSVTTTGSSGQSPIIFQKFGKLNMRSSEGV